MGKDPVIIHASGDIYAIAYEGENSDGYLKTVEISENGDINNTVIDTIEFSAICKNPCIICVSNNLYGVAYRGSGNKGYFTTMHIADNGDIY